MGTFPGGGSSWAKGINDNGQIVVYAETSKRETHAFFYSDGKSQDLGTLPDGKESFAKRINDGGQIVGFATTPDDRCSDSRLHQKAAPFVSKSDGRVK